MRRTAIETWLFVISLTVCAGCQGNVDPRPPLSSIQSIHAIRVDVNNAYCSFDVASSHVSDLWNALKPLSHINDAPTQAYNGKIVIDRKDGTTVEITLGQDFDNHKPSTDTVTFNRKDCFLVDGAKLRQSILDAAKDSPAAQ